MSLSTAQPDIVVRAQGLGKLYPLGTKVAKKTSLIAKARETAMRYCRPSEARRDEIWALDRVSFDVSRGQRLGVIGRNGAGKSTLLKIMSRVVHPTVGEVRIRGRLTSLLEVGTGFNDNLSGRDNIFLNASLYGLSREEILERFEAIVAFSEVARFIDTPVKAYSSGMKMRLAFAVAAHLDPDILLMDEVLAVGDMAFQQKCLERVEDMTSGGRTLLFVSHSMDAVMRYCDRCIWMDQGRIRADGASTDVISQYVEEVLDVKSRLTVANAPRAEAVADRAPAGSGSKAEASRDMDLSEASIGDIEGEKSLDTSLTEATAVLAAGTIRDSMGTESAVVRVDEPVTIEFHYTVSADGFYMPSIQLYCPQGTLAFVSCPPDTDLDNFRIAGPQTVRATVQIPPHLLNIGTYRVTLVVFSPEELPFKRYFTAEHALSFHCIEARPGTLSARGVMPRPFPGPVRPLLDWCVKPPITSSDARLGPAAAEAFR